MAKARPFRLEAAYTPIAKRSCSRSLSLGGIFLQQPLAFRMRPQNLDEVVGQQELVGPGRIIRRMVSAHRLSSMILYGPPGTGKTSIASAIAGSTKYAFRILNAATDTKKDLQIVAEEAKMSGTVILLLDEIHRLDKTRAGFSITTIRKWAHRSHWGHDRKSVYEHPTGHSQQNSDFSSQATNPNRYFNRH